jgi:hypothetical protein
MNTCYSNFLATHPPVFSGARDPLDADDWLCTTESKFGLLHCTEYQKTLYATQQLTGPIGAWWASYLTALPSDHHIERDEFCVAFRGHQLSAGTICHKFLEFPELRQGNRFCTTTPRSSTTKHSTGGITWIVILRRAELYHKGLNIQLQDHLV